MATGKLERSDAAFQRNDQIFVLGPFGRGDGGAERSHRQRTRSPQRSARLARISPYLENLKLLGRFHSRLATGELHPRTFDFLERKLPLELLTCSDHLSVMRDPSGDASDPEEWEAPLKHGRLQSSVVRPRVRHNRCRRDAPVFRLAKRSGMSL